jgi:hypothetical protein
LRSTKKWFYYRIVRKYFGERLDPESIGRTRSVATGELN